MNPRIGGLQSLSTVDWNGHVTSLIFTAGCNFRCPFCQNSALLSMNSGREIELNELLNRIEIDLTLADSIGFTGGEPCLQPELLLETFKWSRKIGLKTYLNTNGSFPLIIENLIHQQLLDYVAFDVKAPLKPNTYSKVIGISNGVEKIISDIKDTIRICTRNLLDFEVRTTVVPTLIDDEDSIKEIARTIRDAPSFILQQFYPSNNVLNEQLRKIRSPKRVDLQALARVAKEEGIKNVYIRTTTHGLEKVELHA